MTGDYQLRNATADDWTAVGRVLAESFHDNHSDDADEAERLVYEPDRTLLVVRDDEIAAVSAAFTRDLTVPGGVVPAAHVTMVSVRPTHRRQGLLNRMIEKLHADALALGEPVAVLWASEGKIYQRYGYGLAAGRVGFDAQNREIQFLDAPADTGRLRPVPLSSVDEFHQVFDEARLSRPGWSNRDDRWWSYVTSDPASSRNGATVLHAVVHDGPSGVDGYLLWRVKSEWDHGGPKDAAMVRELVATTPEAYRALYRFAFSLDLTRSVRVGFAAVDEPLPYMIAEPRRLETRVHDGLWIRILDVPRALAARRYAAPLDVVLDIEDPHLAANTGRWRLVADVDTVTCTRTDAEADLRVPIHELGAAYLGGASLSMLAAAGLVHEIRPGTLVPASIAFGWHRAPSATEIF